MRLLMALIYIRSRRGAFKSMAAGYSVEIADDKIDLIVQNWREANDHIVKWWYDLERAATKAIKTKQRVNIGQLIFLHKYGHLWLKLVLAEMQNIRDRKAMGQSQRHQLRGGELVHAQSRAPHHIRREDRREHCPGNSERPTRRGDGSLGGGWLRRENARPR